MFTPGLTQVAVKALCEKGILEDALSLKCFNLLLSAIRGQ